MSKLCNNRKWVQKLILLSDFHDPDDSDIEWGFCPFPDYPWIADPLWEDVIYPRLVDNVMEKINHRFKIKLFCDPRSDASWVYIVSRYDLNQDTTSFLTNGVKPTLLEAREEILNFLMGTKRI